VGGGAGEGQTLPKKIATKKHLVRVPISHLHEGMVANQNLSNSISTGTTFVPWGPKKIFLLSKMMNFQPQNIQKREIIDFEIIKYKCKSKKKP